MELNELQGKIIAERAKKGHCPFCGSNNQEVIETISANYSVFTRGFVCNKCGREWVMHYLVDYIIENGDDLSVNYDHSCCIGFEDKGNINEKLLEKVSNDIETDILKQLENEDAKTLVVGVSET